MNNPLPDPTNLAPLWERPLQPVRCLDCEVVHLIPAGMNKVLCPACFGSNLDHSHRLNRQEPPELIVDFIISPDQLRDKFKNWVSGIWLHPKELNPDILAQRLTRSFIPLWLVDGKVLGFWQAQMGFDYQVASTQEVFRNGGWITHELIETRIRWEPRTGKIERKYNNIAIPALEEHKHLMERVGNFDFELKISYSPIPLEHSSVRVPNIIPEAGWSIAKPEFDHLAAVDCMIASDAQHYDEFSIDADYSDKNWTQLLLPIYTTAYRDEDGKVYEIMINGQNGKISGVKRASIIQARDLSLGLTALALLCFFLGLLFAVGTSLLPFLGAISLILFASTLFFGLLAPIPAIWAWNFNQKQVRK